jgi:phosphomevalonate kinase
MSDVSGIPVEPESQTRLLDSLTAVEGVYGGVVPGAGGFDALAVLVEDDAGTEARLREFGAEWSGRFPEEKTRLLKVRGEMEGVKQESMEIFEGWLS